MLIGLCGRAGAGKDTAYGYIKEWMDEHYKDQVDCRRDAFADRLKVSAAAALGFTGTKDEALAFCNELKEHGYIDVTLNGVHDPKVHRITGRKYLQVYGTEAHRDVFGQAFWVDMVLNAYDESGLLVITDVRFENEAQAVREHGGEVWKINRPGQEITESKHASEAGLPDKLIDRTVENVGDLNSFRDSIRREMAAFLFWYEDYEENLRD